MYFSTSIFSSVGISGSVMASALVAGANLLVTVAAARLIDSKGRRQLLLVSFAGMSASMFLLSVTLSPRLVAAMTAAVGPDLGAWAAAVTVLATVCYVAAFAIGAGPVPALLVSELCENNSVRASAMAVAMATHWLLNFVVGLLFLPLIEHVGAGPLFAGFGVVCAAGVLFSKACIIETAGKSFQQVELEYAAISERLYYGGGGGGGRGVPKQEEEER